MDFLHDFVFFCISVLCAEMRKEQTTKVSSGSNIFINIIVYNNQLIVSYQNISTYKELDFIAAVLTSR